MAPHRSDAIHGEDGAWDEALERLAPTGPEWAGRLSNHGPMATEALVRLGRPDAIAGWLDSYLTRLTEAPRPRFRIDPGDWREALGDIGRVADWIEHFRHELAEAPWRQVVATWWPRLLPGVSAAATHGVIRTAHAIRGLEDVETPLRLDELARALGYWAAAYQPLPGAGQPAGGLALSEALSRMPRLATGVRGNIIDHLRALDGLGGFDEGVRSLTPPSDPLAALDELILEFARIFVRRGDRDPIAFIHAVTAPVAVRSVLDVVPAEMYRVTYDRLWQTCAGIFAAFARGPEPASPPATPEPAGEAELAERAVASGDEHAIKMTEACLRQYRLTPDPVLLTAAALSIDRLRSG